MADGETEHEVVLGVARGEGSGPGGKDDKYIRSGSMEIELDGPDTDSVFENIPQVDYQTFTEPDSESKEASEEYQQVDLKPQDVSASVHMVESKESSSSQARTELMEVKRTPSQGQVKTDFKGLNYPIDERVPVSDETPQLGDLEPGVQEISTVASERKEEKRSEVEGTGAGGVATAGNTPMELGRMHLEPGDSRAGSGIEIQASKNGENDSVDMGPERDHADPDMRTVDLESSGPGPNRESTDLRLHSTMADSSNLDTSGNPGILESSGEAHHGEPESPIAMRPVSLDPPNGLDSNPEESEPTADGKSVPTSDLSDFRELAQLVEPFTSRIVKQATGKKYAEIRHMARDVHAMLTETEMEQPQTIQTLRKFLILCCAGGKTVSETAADCMHKLIEEQYLGGGNGSKALALDEGNPELFESFISAACKGCKVRDEGFSLRIVRTLLAAVQTVAGVHNKSLLQVVQTIYNIYLNSSSANVKQSSRQALERISAKVFEALEENQYDVAAEKRSEAAENGEPDKERSGEDETLYFKDAYQLFKGLCNLSSKQLPSSSSSESMAVKWKLLALDLLKNVLENSGQNFRTHPKFIHAMRSYLAPSILSNALSGSISVVTSAMEILEMVVVQKSFRAILKREIADIFQSVIFRFLESPTAGYGRRRVVLEVLSTICSDPQTLTDMFLNYDCDMNSIHVFEQMITALCSAAQDGVSGPIATPEEGISGGEAGQLRSEALKALVLSLKSLRAWCSSLEVSDDHEIDPVEPQELSGVGSAVEGSASVATLELDETARFQETLRRKKILEEGVQRFNAKPKAGIDYLSSHGYLNATAEEIAGLLKNVRDLDATVVGEYLGEADEISLEVMKTYTKSFDFGGMPFEDALREFLSGEAQKIDRIMEAFAGQFHEGNPTIFASKDTPFVLAYSTIMLNTDAHNPQVKKKMSKSEFLRNNRGIDDGNDLDAEILETIYDRIVQDEIKLSGDKKDRASESVAGNALGVDRLSRQNWQNMDPRQRNEIFKKESERVLAQAKAQFQKRKAEDIDEIPFYQTASSVHIVRLMLENIWCPILAAMAILLERAGPIDVKTVDLCLDGFRNAIAVVGVFGMDMEKDAFVSSLSKFTLLNSITDMKKKNIECIRVLLAIAASEGSNLGSQWTWMIRAIVQLEQMRAVAANLPNKHRIRNKLPADREESVGNQKITRDGDEISGLSVDANTVLVANSIKDSEVERIFSNSPSLSFAGFYDLCAALCKVSTEELAEGVPVTYCLQKLVEIVLYNIEERQKKQWYRVWQLFSPFFGSALSHKDKDVSLFALDRLKQLVWKFLEADERHAYDFQFLLLKPFESCFSRTTAHPIQESVLTCLSQVALARAANVKSGWKPFYGVMGMAADSKSEEVMKYAYQICDAIVRKHLGVIEEMFIPAISGVGAFTRTPLSSAVAVAALDHLSIRFVSLLSEGKALPAARPLQIEGKVELIFTETVDAHIQTWFPLLIGVSSGITSSLASVRVTATSALFRVLSENGHKFSPGLWTLIYRGVLAPIFDDVKHHLETSAGGGSSGWAMSTGSSALRKLISVVLLNENTKGLLPDVIGLISGWITQSTEAVAREGVTVFTFLLTDGGHIFSEDDWQQVAGVYRTLFKETMPVEIMGPQDGIESVSDTSHSEGDETDRPAPVDFRIVRSKCVVQLLLSQSVLDTVVMNYSRLSAGQVLCLSNLLEESYAFARDFNANSELRFALWRAGFMTQVPNLLKQETTCLQAYVQILFWLAADERSVEGSSPKELLLDTCQKFLAKYAEVCSSPRGKNGRDDARELGARTAIAIFMIEGLLHVSEEIFESVRQAFWGIFVTLLRVSESRNLRDAICDILDKRLSSTLVMDWDESFSPDPRRPGDRRVLNFTVKDPNKTELMQKAVEEMDDVISAEFGEDRKNLRVLGNVPVADVIRKLDGFSSGSVFTSGGAVPFEHLQSRPVIAEEPDSGPASST